MPFYKVVKFCMKIFQVWKIPKRGPVIKYVFIKSTSLAKITPELDVALGGVCFFIYNCNNVGCGFQTWQYTQDVQRSGRSESATNEVI